MGYGASSNGRIMRTGGPDGAAHKVLCLPGGLCTAAFFDDLFAEPAIAEGEVRLIATTLPGFGGVPLPAGFDATVESHAELAAILAADLAVMHRIGYVPGVRAVVAFGDRDDVGLTAAERSALEASATTRLHTVPDCGHMIINQRPAWVAELIGVRSASAEAR
jgi:pimeloyl-ACP methyl ester carboxylesterase